MHASKWKSLNKENPKGPNYSILDTLDKRYRTSGGKFLFKLVWPVLRLFPPCALVLHAQGSSGVVDNMPFVWRGHTKSLTTRARPSPDLAVWLE